MHSPKGGSDGSIQSFVVHLRNVGAARYGSIPILDLFIHQKTAGESTARADQLLDEGDIPRVFMTAYSEKNLECMERLAAIEKPMVTGDLLRAIERVIENRSAGPPPGTASGHD
jgi:hypothetical protein